MADDGFHEIQLNGKQLVFLFMATTVVSVVIFLCGVLVGRGVRAQQDEAAAAADLLPTGTVVATDAPPLEIGAGEDLSPTDLTYSARLGSEQAPEESVRLPEPLPAPEVAEPVPPASDAVPAAARPDGFTIQVAALRERAEANALVERLATKGYSAYLVEPTPGSPAAVYRVRVGRYDEKSDAETVVRRLEREEQFKPWITR